MRQNHSVIYDEQKQQNTVIYLKFGHVSNYSANN